jgi:hypothetical protein
VRGLDHNICALVQSTQGIETCSSSLLQPLLHMGLVVCGTIIDVMGLKRLASRHRRLLRKGAMPSGTVGIDVVLSSNTGSIA